MPNIGHNIKQLKEYSYDAFLKFGDFTVKELYQVTITKFYPSGYVKERSIYNDKGLDRSDKFLESRGETDILNLNELLESYREFDHYGAITSHQSDEKGNWIMMTYERAAIYRVCDELYIKQTREIEYY